MRLQCKMHCLSLSHGFFGAFLLLTGRLCKDTHRVQLQLLELKSLPLKKSAEFFFPFQVNMTLLVGALVIYDMVEEFEYQL